MRGEDAIKKAPTDGAKITLYNRDSKRIAETCNREAGEE
jgi:hypothetical protein